MSLTKLSWADIIYFMYLSVLYAVCCVFLISSGWGGRVRSRWERSESDEVEGENKRGGGLGWRGGAGRLSYFIHLNGPSRAIKLLCVPAPPSPMVWALKLPSWALHLLGLSLANICVAP
jgi:hypothetical protein